MSAQLNAHGHRLVSRRRGGGSTTPSSRIWARRTTPRSAVEGRAEGGRQPLWPGQLAVRRRHPPVNLVVTGLTPNTTYYFRACAQDQSWSQGACDCHELQDAGRDQLRVRPQMGQPGSGTASSLRPGIATDSPATSTSPTRQRPRSRSSARPARSSPSGALAGGQWPVQPPIGIATDSAGNVYVADTGNHRIQKFSSTGGFITQWGTRSATGSSTTPSGIATAAAATSTSLTTRQPRSEVQLHGGFHHHVGLPGDGRRSVQHPPWEVATDSASNVYVSDAFLQRPRSEVHLHGRVHDQVGDRGHRRRPIRHPTALPPTRPAGSS